MGLKISFAFAVLFTELVSSSLVVEDSIDTEHWMERLGDMRLIDIPVIPGTHHSGTATDPDNLFDKVAWGFGKCQSMGVLDQLHHGVRFLDFRLTVDAKHRSAVISHRIESGASFESVLNSILQFLTNHPGEGVLMYVRVDFDSKKPDNAADIISEIVLKSKIPIVAIPYTQQESISALKISAIAGHVLIVTEEETLTDAVPHLLRTVLDYKDIWREPDITAAQSKVDEYMTADVFRDSSKLGGVALDGFFPIQTQAHTSPQINSWFMYNIEANIAWKAKIAKRGIGIVLMDFVDPKILHALVGLNFHAQSEKSLRGV